MYTRLRTKSMFQNVAQNLYKSNNLHFIKYKF